MPLSSTGCTGWTDLYLLTFNYETKYHRIHWSVNIEAGNCDERSNMIFLDMYLENTLLKKIQW